MSSFRNNTIATINYIECPSDIDGDAAKEFQVKTQVWRDLPSKIHALDFRRVKRISAGFYPMISDFQKGLREKNLRLVTINVAPTIEQQLTKDGVITQFGFIKDFRSLLNQKPQKVLNPDEVRQTLVKYIVDAARRAMETLFEVTVAADENFLQNPRDFEIHEFHRAAVLDMTSNLFTAQFRLYFSQATLFNLTRKMVGEANSDEETLNSTATELLNMIYGGAKSFLNDEKSFNLPPAIPSLVLKDQIIELKRTLDPRKCLLIPFASPLGTYYLEIDFGL